MYPVGQPKIVDGTVLIRGARIAAVGRSVRVPSGAQVIDCKGKRVTPGFIDAMTQIGLVEVSLEARTVDGRPADPDPIRAALRVDDAVDMRSTLVGVARRQGVTSVVSAPAGGLIAGRASWIDLVGPKSAFIDRAVSGPTALRIHLGERGAAAVFGSRAAAFNRLREVFDDARTLRRSQAQFRRRGLFELSASRLDLEAIGEVLARRTRVVISAHRASDIDATLRFARAQGLRIAIEGAAEGWLVANALAKAKVPVIVNSFANLPSAFEARNARSDNVALMAKAGVKIAVTSEGTHNVSGLRFSAGNAVRTGVDPEVALAAVTAVPAEIYGRANQYGTLKAGRVANVVVWTGDPFEPSSFAETIIIRGEIQPTASRQTRLAKRYMDKLGLHQNGKKSGMKSQ